MTAAEQACRQSVGGGGRGECAPIKQEVGRTDEVRRGRTGSKNKCMLLASLSSIVLFTFGQILWALSMNESTFREELFSVFYKSFMLALMFTNGHICFPVAHGDYYLTVTDMRSGGTKYY